MKVKQKKLLAMLICVVLSVTDIFPVGLNVSASELEQPESNNESRQKAA